MHAKPGSHGLALQGLEAQGLSARSLPLKQAWCPRACSCPRYIGPLLFPQQSCLSPFQVWSRRSSLWETEGGRQCVCMSDLEDVDILEHSSLSSCTFLGAEVAAAPGVTDLRKPSLGTQLFPQTILRHGRLRCWRCRHH